MKSVVKKFQFNLAKKALCVLVAATLVLMMVPTALFRTSASAEEAQKPEENFVKADNDVSKFGQFAFNPNSNGANLSVYTQNDLLHVVGCKAETEESIVDKANAQIKKTLTDNLHSVVNDTLPAVKEGFKTTLTSIETVTSNIACLSAGKVADSSSWKFITSAPADNKQTGALEITAKYAHYTADYDVELNGSPITSNKEIKVDNKNFAAGKIVISPQVVNGKQCYKLSVDLDIINIATNPFKHTITVVSDTSKQPVNTKTANDITIDLKGDYFSSAQSMMTLEAQCNNLATIINNSEKSYVLQDGTTAYLGIKSNQDKLLLKKDYKVKWTAASNIPIQTEYNGKPLFKLYTNTERTAPYEGAEEFSIINDNFDVSAPIKIGTLENYNFFDGGDSNPTDPTEYFNTNTSRNKIKVQAVNDEKLCNFEEGVEPNFVNKYCYPVPVNQKSSASVPVKIYVCDNSGKVSVIDTTIMYQEDNDLYMGYEIIKSSEMTPFSDFVEWAQHFFFGKNTVKIKFKYGVTAKNINSMSIKENNTDIAGLSGAPVETDPITSMQTQTFTLDRSSGNFDVDMSNWKIQPLDVNGKKIVKKQTSVTQGMTNPTTRIIANAPAPTKTSIAWNVNGENRAPKEGELFKKGDKVSYTVTLTDDSKLFDYSWKYAKEGPEKDKVNNTIISVTTGPEGCKDTDFENQNIVKISDLEHTDGTTVWSKTKELNLDGNAEFDVSFSYSEIVDMLGRKAQDSQASTNWNFGVDNGNPVLTVDYNPASPVNVYHDTEFYYQKARSATICVKDLHFGETKDSGNSLINVERHFKNEDNVDKGSEKFGAKVSDWQHNGLDHTLVVTFPEQGDYNLVVSGTDRAQNKLIGVLGNVPVDENGKYTSEKWTQDWRSPSISVSWDNNNAVNGKYYTSGRTATFVMEERNFASELIKVNPIVTPGNDGTMGSTNFSGWSSCGNNLWTCTVNFPTEGTYSLTMDGTDKAKNAMSPYSQSEFVIDWTKPTINISGVENRQAYGDTAQPTVSVTDTNVSTQTTCNVESLGITKGHPYNASPAASPAQITYSYSNPEKVAENDGVYRIQVNAVDMAGNSNTQSIVWSVNRFGSTYVIDADTEPMIDGYVNDSTKKDVKVVEINPSGLQNNSIDMTKGSFTETLKKGEDFTTDEKGGGESWYECTYTVPKDKFKEDGKYTLNYYSTDSVGNQNENTMEKNQERNAAVNVQFVLDNAKPTVAWDNLSEDQYGDVVHKATAKFEDNSNKFNEAKIYINGEEKYVSGDDLDKQDNKIEFELNESNNPYTIEAVSTDKAGNTMDKVTKTVLVSSNPFIRWFYNTPLFIGSIVALVLIAGGVGYLIYRKKNKVIN